MTDKDFQQFSKAEPMQIIPNMQKIKTECQEKATYINGDRDFSKASSITETANCEAADIVLKTQVESEEIRRRIDSEVLQMAKHQVASESNNLVGNGLGYEAGNEKKICRNDNFPTMEQIIAEQERLKRVGKVKRNLRRSFAILTVIAAVTVLLTTMCFPVLQIYGTSMAPMLNDGEIAVAVKNNKFNIGNIVAFYCNNEILVKRIICGPGDLIDIDESGNVYVNDAQLNEPYISEKNLGDCDITFPYRVPADSYFVMGDNRSVSIDSRNTLVGCVRSEQIIGRVVLRVWPMTSFSWIS